MNFNILVLSLFFFIFENCIIIDEEFLLMFALLIAFIVLIFLVSDFLKEKLLLLRLEIVFLFLKDKELLLQSLSNIIKTTYFYLLIQRFFGLVRLWLNSMFINYRLKISCFFLILSKRLIFLKKKFLLLLKIESYSVFNKWLFTLYQVFFFFFLRKQLSV